jgi:hypothetical protein
MWSQLNLPCEDDRRQNDVIFTGTLEQVKTAVGGCRRIGSYEVHFDPTFHPRAQQLDRWLGLMEQLRVLV